MSPADMLVTFDIDGTICRSVGEGANFMHKAAFAHAFKEVFSLDASIDEVHHHGSTDGLILVKVLVHRGVSKEEAMRRLPDLKSAMVASMEQVLAADPGAAAVGLELLPGVAELLQALAQRGIRVGLTTGNLEAIAWAKMRALGIDSLFGEEETRLGGFGSDFCDGDFESEDGPTTNRAELLRVARQRAEAAASSFGGSCLRHVHIGDAPADVRAAVKARGTPLGVCTGIFGRAELESSIRSETGGDMVGSVLDSLADTAGALDAMGLK
ncbi:unnamed protein product [Polarella glacialis]|uniref:5'-nucleotidase n=1 Tax=Polarella glacialis TaxID=89957 RepID=A0A813DR12_POLGL|nr:unnamed protein product [Polarella glacialis]